MSLKPVFKRVVGTAAEDAAKEVLAGLAALAVPAVINATREHAPGAAKAVGGTAADAAKAIGKKTAGAAKAVKAKFGK